MRKTITTILLISSLTLLGGMAHAKQRGAAIMADEGPPEPPDPKKKKPGEECKSSDECQRHHECKKDGDKGVCTAPPRHRLPPGAVT
jgi:hypothetical protein